VSDDSTGGYPSGWDVEWVAVDRRGRVGVFTTGGAGPIPRAYLASPAFLQCVRDAVWDAPERTESFLLVQLPRPDDYVAFARRGFFAFDWADTGRTSGRSGLYELQARPAVAVDVGEVAWPVELQPILRRIQSDTLDFEQVAADVSELDCEQGP
jgi:hypothetical protein